jgi:hypothetical protein
MLIRTFSMSAIFLASIIAGCSTFKGYPDPPGKDKLHSLKYIDQTFYDTLNSYTSSDEFRRQDIRNAFIRQRMVEIDFSYLTFERKLQTESLIGTGYSDWASTTLTAAIPGTSSVHGKNVLSGLATLLSTSKNVYNNEVLAQSTMPALVAEMRANRAKKRKEIIDKLPNDVSGYDLYSAWADLNEYYETGTLSSAINSLNSTALKKREKEEREAPNTNQIESEALPPLVSASDTNADTGDANSDTSPAAPAEPETPAADSSDTALPTEPEVADAAEVPPAPVEPIISGSNPVSATETNIPTPPPVITHVLINMNKPAKTLEDWIGENPNNQYALETWLHNHGQNVVVGKFLGRSSYADLQRQAIKDLMQPASH